MEAVSWSMYLAPITIAFASKTTEEQKKNVGHLSNEDQDACDLAMAKEETRYSFGRAITYNALFRGPTLKFDEHITVISHRHD